MKVVIAGGGLSGLLFAHGLAKHGIDCQVFERHHGVQGRQGYYLTMNAFGGNALQALLSSDLYELYLDASRKSYARKGSVVLTSDLHELSFQPHKGPPNEGERNHTGLHRKVMREILVTRLGPVLTEGVSVSGYSELEDRVDVSLSNGETVSCDLLVGADGIRSVVRAQRLPDVRVIDTGIQGIGVYACTPMTDELRELAGPPLDSGVAIVVDRNGTRVLIVGYEPRESIVDAAHKRAPDAHVSDCPPYVMVSAGVERGFVVPPNDSWNSTTASEIRASQLRATEGWHPLIQSIIAGQDLSTMFMVPFGYVEVPAPWEPSRVTLIGDSIHAMLPTLGMGANLAMNDARLLVERLVGVQSGAQDLVGAVGAYEQSMREVVYPIHAMTLEHDRNFGGGALQQ